jgi:putative oxidoreductase
MRAIVPIGRAMFALIFLPAVFTHFSSGTIAAASAHGVPLATILVPAAGILAFIGGASVLLGYRARLGAFLLILFLVPVTLVMHKFWGIADPQIAAMQKIQFMKNMSLVGTSLLIIYFGSGPVSLDG